MSSQNAIIRRVQRFSLKDFAQMLASKPQRLAEEQAERVLVELEKELAKAQESVKTAITENLDKAQKLFSDALPLIVRNTVKKSGELTVEMLENDAAMTTVAHTAYTLMPSVFRLVIKEDLFTKLLLQSRTALVEYLENLETTSQTKS